MPIRLVDLLNLFNYYRHYCYYSSFIRDDVQYVDLLTIVLTLIDDVNSICLSEKTNNDK